MKIKKIFIVLERKAIKLLCYINTDIYMSKYIKYLKKIGINFTGNNKLVKYIDPTVYFDGTDYKLIHIGDNVTISREVMLLTHDYSITSALCTLGKKIDRHQGEIYLKKSIIIGDNCFIGARASILPGTIIENNCIVGACTVVKGRVAEGSVIIGNPSKVVCQTYDYARKEIEKDEYFIE